MIDSSKPAIGDCRARRRKRPVLLGIRTTDCETTIIGKLFLSTRLIFTWSAFSGTCSPSDERGGTKVEHKTLQSGISARRPARPTKRLNFESGSCRGNGMRGQAGTTLCKYAPARPSGLVIRTHAEAHTKILDDGPKGGEFCSRR